MTIRLLAIDDAENFAWKDRLRNLRHDLSTKIKEPCRVATAAALPASSLVGNVLTATANGSINVVGIDGLTDLAVNDRILVLHEELRETNGIYVITTVGTPSTPWVMTRATDADTVTELPLGTVTRILDGASHLGRLYQLGMAPTTLGVSHIVWGAVAIVGTSGSPRLLREDGVWTQEVVIENRTSDPPAPVDGQLWLRTDL